MSRSMISAESCRVTVETCVVYVMLRIAHCDVMKHYDSSMNLWLVLSYTVIYQSCPPAHMTRRLVMALIIKGSGPVKEL